MITFEPLYRTLAKKDMTMSELADRLGVKVQTVAGMIYKCSGRVSRIEEICDVLDCRINEVISDNGQFEADRQDILGELVAERTGEDNRFQTYLQDHPWLKGIDVKSVRKILFPV